MADVFISYSQEDRDWVQTLAAALEEERLWVWWDHVIRPGEKYRDVIDRELNAAKVAIVVWSHHSVKSDWVLGEADDARQLGILLPILMEDVKTPREFRGHQTANLSHWNGHPGHAGFRSLVNAIRTMTGHASSDSVRDGSRAQASEPPARTQLRAEAPATVIQRRATRSERNAHENIGIDDSFNDADSELEERTNPLGYVLGIALLAGIILLGYHFLSSESGSSGTVRVAATRPDAVIAQAEKAASDARQAAKQADATGEEALTQFRTALNLAESLPLLPVPGQDSKYAGQWSNNQPQGLGKKISDPVPKNCGAPAFENTDKPISAGQWDQGKMKGLGAQTNCKGFIYKGQFSDGRPEGLGVSIGSDGTTYRGTFGTITRAGEPFEHQPTLGVKTFSAPNLSREEAGKWGDRGLDGPGVVVCANGEWWEASWTNGARNGYARKVDANGKVLQEGHFAPGQSNEGSDPTNARLCSAP